VEASALRSLQAKVLSNKSVLLAEFIKFDPENKGKMKLMNVIPHQHVHAIIKLLGSPLFIIHVSKL
jgi:hypothetical protein